MPRYLTKSRFVLAVECETKLFYTGKAEYADYKKNDPFLSALAEGGFQVGEMAKLYFPGGHEIETLEHEQALAQTRADILVKNGSTLDLIEVKSKSFNGTGPRDMLKRDGTIKINWVPYLYDVAFQKHVLALAFPDMEIRSYLLLADKNARASVDGLNQRFLIYKENGRSKVSVREGTTRELLGDPILIRIPVDEITEKIYTGTDGYHRDLPFANWVRFLAEHYERDRKIRTGLGSKCKKCEFICTTEEERSGLKSGLKECWQEQAGLKEPDFAEPLVIHLGNSKRKDSFLEQGIYLLRELDSELLRPAGGGGGGASDTPGLSVFERQCLQVEKARSRDPNPYFDAEGLKAEMMKWVYPLHFIDFETTAVAIPFNRGMAPYEGIAFQFSHHRVDEDGGIAHAGQYLHGERGQFPSFEFLRALKKNLEEDEGTVFRYADHENTYLNIIYSQLQNADPEEVPDRQELSGWITTVARPTKRNTGAWVAGKRNMVDLLDLVKR